MDLTPAMNALKLSFLLLIGLLTACASHHVPLVERSDTTPSKQPQGLLKTTTLSSWELSGAIAARNQKKGWSAAVNWEQQGPNRYRIHLSGPLGGGAVLIESNGDTVTYTDAPKRVSSQHADTLLQQQTGIRLPVHALYYWVRGIPAPGPITSKQYDQQSHLISLSQAGYTIHILGYTSVNHMDLPSKIQLAGHGVVIKLIIKQWHI